MEQQAISYVQQSPSIALANLLRHPKQRFAPLLGAHLKMAGKEAFELVVLKGQPYAFYQTTPGEVVAENITCIAIFSFQVYAAAATVAVSLSLVVATEMDTGAERGSACKHLEGIGVDGAKAPTTSAVGDRKTETRWCKGRLAMHHQPGARHAQGISAQS